MAYLAPLTKATASLIIDEISLFETSVLIYSPILTNDSISEMQSAIPPTAFGSTNEIEAPQSGRAVLTSLTMVSMSAMRDEISFLDLASLMKDSTCLAS
jgi:hypothetical protein